MEDKRRELAGQVLTAVWCSECCHRIAPYDLRTVLNGKDYHRHCFQKRMPQGRGQIQQAHLPKKIETVEGKTEA
jgi:hypothetical protein